MSRALLLTTITCCAALLAVPRAEAAPDRRPPAAGATDAAAPLAVHAARELPRLIRELGAGQPLVLHFWATWCGACVDEFRRLGPALLALQGRGVRVALVSVDEPRTRPRAPRMLAQLGMAELPALVLDAPSPEPVARALGEPGFEGALPATFVFDRHGKKTGAFLRSVSAAELEAAVGAAE